MSFNPLKTSFTRVFLIEGRARPNKKPSYESCLRMGGLSQAFGDIEKIECPDPENYGKFIEVGKIKGAEERPSTNLIGKYAADLASEILRLAKIGCPVDVQLHAGVCTDPSEFNAFTKAVVLEDVGFTNFSTDDLGALSEDENAEVNETGDISAREVYEVLQLSLVEKAGSLVTVELIDVARCDRIGCGECEDVSDGCEKYYAISGALPASPGTVPEIIFTLDHGATWHDHDVDSLTAVPNAIGCVSGYVVVISNADNAHHYAEKILFDRGLDPVFARIAAGYVVGGEPNDIWSVGSYAFIVGDGGYVYGLDDPAVGVVVLDAGIATTQTLNAVHALSSEFAVAVGHDGAVIFTENGESWAYAPNQPVGVAVHLECVWARSENEWWTGDNTGRLWYTLDGGISWTEKPFPGSGTGIVQDIQFPKDSIGFMSHETIEPRGRLLRSYDGGYSWQVLPEGDATIPLNAGINAIATCPHDPNIVIGVGLATDLADGFIVVGTD